jgi:hypothetical protein
MERRELSRSDREIVWGLFDSNDRMVAAEYELLETAETGPLEFHHFHIRKLPLAFSFVFGGLSGFLIELLARR